MSTPIEALADAALYIEPVGTMEVVPRPDDGRVIVRVNSLSRPDDVTMYYAMLAKLDTEGMPTFVAVCAVEPDDDGGIVFDAEDDRVEEFRSRYLPPGGELHPCNLPPSLSD